jgi:predicted SAM-dependent methyltransferase
MNMNKIDKAKQILEEEGLVPLVGKSIRYIGDEIIEKNKINKKKEIIRSYDENCKYLNIGGGDFVREDWRVLDYYSEHYDYSDIFVDYKVNLEKQKEWEICRNSFDIVYSSATLEHLSQPAVEHTLSEAHRVIKSGGGIHITVPDTDLILNMYEDRNLEWIGEIQQPKIGDNGYIPCPDGFEPEYYLMRRIATPFVRKEVNAGVDFGKVQTQYEDMNKIEFLNEYTRRIKDEWHREHPGGHRNWFNYDKLHRLLKKAGFSDIERVYTRRSRFTELCKEGFDPRPQWSVHVEATK